MGFLKKNNRKGGLVPGDALARLGKAVLRVVVRILILTTWMCFRVIEGVAKTIREALEELI